MKQYHELLRHVLDNGVVSEDRTGTGTISVFGTQSRYNLQDGFPAVTTKKLAFKAMVAELMWFLEGSYNERRLAELTFGQPASQLAGKETIWSKDSGKFAERHGLTNTDEFGNVGCGYGVQWRRFGSETDSLIDQIRELIAGIKENPYGRRHLVTAWNPNDLEFVALPPCHTGFQMYVRDGKLSCQFMMRSNDLGLGACFNVASYALLTHIIARECGLDVGELIHVNGDAHIYLNHIDALKEQLTRTPRTPPKLMISDDFDLNEVLDGRSPLNITDFFKLEGYDPYPAIKMDMSF